MIWIDRWFVTSCNVSTHGKNVSIKETSSQNILATSVLENMVMSNGNTAAGLWDAPWVGTLRGEKDQSVSIKARR